MPRQLLVLLFFGLVATIVNAGHSERILLRNVQVLTLHHGKWTTGKRTRPVPQLTCIGGTNRCKFLPPTVQCYNRGSDGQDIQWECKAAMDRNLRFNKIEVTCEGYDYPEDDYVLIGSCGLEYSIDTTDGKTPFPEPQFQRPDPRNLPHNFHRKGDPGLGTVLILGIIAASMYLIYTRCVKGQRPETSAPPPPGFRTGFVPPGPIPASAPPFEAEGPGFWSGLGLGALGGYFAGRQQSDGPNIPSAPPANEYQSAGNQSGGWFGTTRRRRPQTADTETRESESRERSDGSEQVATGFGGTKRR